MFDELDDKPKRRGRKKSIEWLRLVDGSVDKVILAYECDRLTYDEAKDIIMNKFIELRNDGKDIILLKKKANINTIISGIIQERLKK
tara:strand:- start:25378 stop:25638 length:261 start_codon:yes stop_codon:yes gene_type:complete